LRLPFDLMGQVVFLQSSLPSRFSLFTCLFSGLVVALGVDRLVFWRGFEAAKRAGTHRVGAALAVLMAAAAFIPLVPDWPYQTPQTRVPPFFTSSAERAVPVASVVVIYPFPRSPQHDQAMMWQAIDGMRYRLPGGYVITPKANGEATFFGRLSTTEEILSDCYYGRSVPSFTPAVLKRVRTNLETWGTGTVIVTRLGADPDAAVRLFTLALREKPRRSGGVWVWFDVRPRIGAGT